MNRHSCQSVTYQQIGDSVNYLDIIHADIYENTGGSEEDNYPNNIQ